jgi:NAD(P)-dependent dehydrogenase (short-subunit alcohol dehydrogenase family)
MEIKGNTFIVTGGSSGLGAACVRMLVEAGGRAVIADVQDEAGQALADELGDATHFVHTDVTGEESVRSAVETTADMFGGLQGAVNCAGIGIARKVLSSRGMHDLDSFARVIAINLTGTFNVIRLVAEAMSQGEPNTAGERGVIVNTASVAIRVNTIAPGLFDTPMLAGLPEKARQSLAQQVPFPSRLGEPAEYAALVRHIVENQMLNGEVIRLDGAIRMAPR